MKSGSTHRRFAILQPGSDIEYCLAPGVVKANSKILYSLLLARGYEVRD